MDPVGRERNHRSKHRRNFLTGVLIGLILWWLAGFNFNERGGDAFVCALLALMCGASLMVFSALWEKFRRHNRL